jgi:hypothetical protein
MSALETKVFRRTLSASFAALLASSSLHAQPPPGPPPPPCPRGDSNFICMGAQQGPEDLIALEGDQWVVASSMSGDGGLALIRASDRAVTKAYPAPGAKEQLDAKTYAGCPGPPAAGRFTTHGLYAQREPNGHHRVFAVGHGARESIEVFDVDTRPAAPQVTWIGCVVAPDPIGLNSVRGLPDGGFITTNFLPRGVAGARDKLLAGEKNGELWEWHPGGQWQKVPGSEASGANGVELSPDGKTLYIAAWGSESFIRLSRGATPVVRDEIPLGFRVDNIHWARDGALVAVGQGTGVDAQHWLVAKIDPKTLAVRQVLTRADTDGFNAGTAAAEVGKGWWIGSFRGDRIAILPPP